MCDENLFNILTHLAEENSKMGLLIYIKAVQLPHDDDIKQLLTAVFDHVLEFWTIICLGRNSPVDIMPQDGDAVLFRKDRTLAKLTFDGFFTLAIG